MERASFDAIVIGGGHNGLVAACYLSKAGLRTLLVERRPVLGGASVTEELWPGCRLNRLAYAYGLFREEIVEELELRRRGLELVVHEPFSFIPFPDGRYLFLWNDRRRTSQEIAKFSEHDARAYHEYAAFWDRVGELFDILFLSPPPPVEALGGLLGDVEAQETMKRLLFYSAKDLLDEYFESEEVKAAFATQAIIGTMAGPMTPGTAYVLGHHVLGKVNGIRGAWAYVKGGIGALIAALEDAARSYGVEIVKGVSVEKVLLGDGEARGVELSDGRRFAARVVLSSADPKQTLLRLVGEEHLEKGLARRLRALKDEGCVLKINAVVRELPDYRALPGKGAGPQHAGTTDIAPSLEYLERAYDEAKYGRMSKEPFMEVVFHSVSDPGLCPPGLHTMSIFAQYFPYSIKEGSWDELREEAARRVLETFSQYAPNMRSAVEKMEVLTPLDMERIFSLPKGNIFHIEIVPSQLLFFRPLPGLSNYRTPVKGLYLCGSGAHPGGGVTGAPGYLAARAALEDLGKA